MNNKKVWISMMGMLLAVGCMQHTVAAEAKESTVVALEQEYESVLPEPMISDPEFTRPEIALYKDASYYLPSLKAGNYERFIDRAELPQYALDFYEMLIEATDNDGYQDFLIDAGSSNLVETITLVENGVTANAAAVKVLTVKAEGTTQREANEEINERFYESYYALRTAFEAFDRDHAEVFWLSGSYYIAIPSYQVDRKWNDSIRAYEYLYTGDVYLILKSSIFSIHSSPYQSADVIRAKIHDINVNVQSITNATAGMTEEARLRYYNNWLTRNNEYNHRIGLRNENIQAVQQSYPDAFECTAALTGLSGTLGPVCESYARAMKVLCDNSGIPCVLVDGYALNAVTAIGENHMWNYVKLDGCWYAVDVTWNDPLSYTYGALSGAEHEEYMLVGALDELSVGDGTMPFLRSHPVNNKMYSDSNGYPNGPVLSERRYTATMKSLTVTTSEESVAYGYTPQPILTATVEKMNGYSGEVTYTWYDVDASGNETFLYSGTENIWTLPYNLQPGTHTIRVYASLGQGIKSADISIKVIRTQFSDVRTTSYYHDAVIWAVLNNVTTGYKDDQFAPNLDCTRGQVVTFLWRANGCPEPQTTSNPFVDIKPSDYYYQAVLWAAENGITTGLTQTTFAPKDTITRGQCATFLWRTEGCPEYEGQNPFTDIKEGAYYYDAVLWALENGITTGIKEDAFAPNESCTRGQVVCFLYRNNNQ